MHGALGDFAHGIMAALAWWHRPGRIALAASPWPHRPGRIALAASPWPHRPGRIALAASPWPHRHGRIALAAWPWPHGPGRIALAASPWPHRLGSIWLPTTAPTISLSTQLAPNDLERFACIVSPSLESSIYIYIYRVAIFFPVPDVCS